MNDGTKHNLGQAARNAMNAVGFEIEHDTTPNFRATRWSKSESVLYELTHAKIAGAVVSKWVLAFKKYNRFGVLETITTHEFDSPFFALEAVATIDAVLTGVY